MDRDGDLDAVARSSDPSAENAFFVLPNTARHVLTNWLDTEFVR